MSKSLGNLVFVGDLLAKWEPAAVRVALLGHHYRTDWEWTPGDMPAAADRLKRWRAASAPADRTGEAGLEVVRGFLDDDLDSPGALRALDDEARAGRGVAGGAALLGVTL
jgi:L-cysteine:1D-myo-inositol 2-amino-2-deoxy-alpha-D-glucopyranoside ligase